MKPLFLTFFIFLSLFQHILADTNLVECLKISGNFNQPVQIWNLSYFKLNNVILMSDKDVVKANNSGLEQMRLTTLNNQKCWKRMNPFPRVGEGVVTYMAFVTNNITIPLATIEHVFLTQDQITDFYKYPQVSIPHSTNNFEITSLIFIDNRLILMWDYDSNSVYDIYKTTNLLENFTLIVTNKFDNFFIESFTGNIGFYKIIRKDIQ